MSDEISRIALHRADAATADAHELRNDLNDTNRRVDRVEWDLKAALEKQDEDCDRITAVEEEQRVQRTATERLALSVDRLAAKLPDPKSPAEHVRESWKSAKPKTRAGIVTAIVALCSPSAIELIKQISVLADKLAHFIH